MFSTRKASQQKGRNNSIELRVGAAAETNSRGPREAKEVPTSPTTTTTTATGTTSSADCSITITAPSSTDEEMPLSPDAADALLKEDSLLLRLVAKEMAASLLEAYTKQQTSLRHEGGDDAKPALPLVNDALHSLQANSRQPPASGGALALHPRPSSTDAQLPANDLLLASSPRRRKYPPPRPVKSALEHTRPKATLSAKYGLSAQDFVDTSLRDESESDNASPLYDLVERVKSSNSAANPVDIWHPSFWDAATISTDDPPVAGSGGKAIYRDVSNTTEDPFGLPPEVSNSPTTSSTEPSSSASPGSSRVENHRTQSNKRDRHCKKLAPFSSVAVKSADEEPATSDDDASVVSDITDGDDTGGIFLTPTSSHGGGDGSTVGASGSTPVSTPSSLVPMTAMRILGGLGASTHSKKSNRKPPQRSRSDELPLVGRQRLPGCTSSIRLADATPPSSNASASQTSLLTVDPDTSFRKGCRKKPEREEAPAREPADEEPPREQLQAPATAAPCTKPSPRRKSLVSFGQVYIRNYDRIISDNPSCHRGVSLGIGWHYVQLQPRSVGDWEKIRTRADQYPRRPAKQLRLCREARRSLVLSLGYSERDVACAVRELNKARFQRRQTVNNLEFQAMEEAVELAARKIKKVLFLQRPGNQKALQQQIPSPAPPAPQPLPARVYVEL